MVRVLVINRMGRVNFHLFATLAINFCEEEEIQVRMLKQQVKTKVTSA